MMKLYFNNANGCEYEVLARYFNDVMLLKSEGGNYIVARWIHGNEWGSGHYWMNDFENAKKDFIKIAWEEYACKRIPSDNMPTTFEDFNRIMNDLFL